MQHFMTFTAESMAALRQAIKDGHQQRRESTRTLLTESRRSRKAAESERRSRAAHDSNSRETFVSTLRMQVATLRDGFRVWRKEVAGELRAAQNAFRGGADPVANRRGDGHRAAQKPEQAQDPLRAGRTGPMSGSAAGERRHDQAAPNQHEARGVSADAQTGDEHSRDPRRPQKR